MISFNLTIVWTIVNLIVLYLIYRKFLYNRVQKTLDDRKNSINSKFKQAKEEKEKALWLLLLCFFPSTWACPMQIGLSQECRLFYLKSSLWSSNLPCFF